MAASITFTANAQARVNVSINIGSQPVWGPEGYDYVDYYYLPDIDMYYYVPDHLYIYRVGNGWRRSGVLPSQYRNFDLYRAHKVVINKVTQPYLRDYQYQRQYGSYKGKHDQVAIRDSRNEKYFVNKDHPQHDQWERQQQQSRSNAGNHERNDGRNNNSRNGNDRNNDGRSNHRRG